MQWLDAADGILVGESDRMANQDISHLGASMI
jgi:hypothetical protein